MSDTLTKPRAMTKAESFTRHAQQVRPAPGTLPIGPNIPAPADHEPSPPEGVNDDEQPVAIGGQRQRTYSGQARAVKSGLSTLWVYDSESELAYEVDYEELHTKLWTPKHANVMILEADVTPRETPRK